MSRKPLAIAACVLIILIAAILLTGLSTTASQDQPSCSWTEPSAARSKSETFEDIWEYWQHDDLKGLDPWGDAGSKAMDIVAVYEKEEPDSLQFRLDFLNLPTETITPTHFALDFMAGGTTFVEPGNVTVTFDIEWDLMVSISGTNFALYDANFAEHPDLLVNMQVDRQLDFVAFAIGRDAFTGWDGSAFDMQAMATNPGCTVILDEIAPVATDDTAGRAQLVLLFGNPGNYTNPAEIGHYDGFGFRPDLRPGERRGLRYVLDAVEEYEIPLTHIDSRTEILPGLEYLRITDRIRTLASRGLLEPLAGLGYGHFMVWQPDDVDAKAIEIVSDIRQDLDLPASTVFYPYEAMITPGDIQVIQDAGFGAIFGHAQYRYWFGWIEDWSDPVAVQEEFESWRKVHVINGMPFVFDNRIGNYLLGTLADDRWEEIDWEEWSEYEQFEGTDQGLDLWWRRIFHDMAIDPDQEQFFSVGTDIDLTAWIFPDAVDWNFRWLASHPWIEATTFSSILDRNWAVIDHGDLGLAPDEQLIRYQRPDGDCGYNAFFPLHYYGGITDDRCPEIPVGLEIEAYYDYIPYLRDGALIQPARIMGDDQTPGSIIYETLHNLRTAPDNPLAELAWLSYFMHIGEQTWHDGLLLSDRAKLQASFVLQVNKLAYAATWAEEAAKGTLSAEAQVVAQDLDLDGENEYIMSNDRVLAIFENDGGRLEYAFAYDDEYGPVQLVSPGHQCIFKPSGFDYTNGEVAHLLGLWQTFDGAFIDQKLGEPPPYYGVQYGVYSPLVTSNSLSFESESFPLTKTFTLEGDTVLAHYDVGPGEEILHIFSLYANRLGVFESDWPETFEEIVLHGSHGWQMTTGGLALLNFEDTAFSDRDAFSDSPAREEMQEREDPSTYPWGHYLEFPRADILSYGAGGGDISLTLRASPINRVFLPVVVKED